MLSKFYSLNPQFYFSLFKGIKPNKKSPLDFKRSLKKAISYKYQGLLFDESFLSDTALYESLKNGLQVGIYIRAKNFKEQALKLNKKFKTLFFNIVFENPSELEGLNVSQKSFFTYVVTRRNKNLPFKNLIRQEFLAKTEVYFPLKENFFDPFLTPKEIYSFLKKQGPVRPIYNYPYDCRISPDMDLRPLTSPFINKNHSEDIVFSVIIPSYNNEIQVLNCLKKLSVQDFPKKNYEVIVVDDASQDRTRAMLRAFASKTDLNFKAIHFPMVMERNKVGGPFRAGIARNLGAKHSSGSFLAFLDSDILVQKKYLSKLKEELELWDLVQTKRYHLKNNAPIGEGDLDHEKLKKWIYIEEKRYWKNFYDKGFKIQNPWKYVCSYSLTLRKKDFLLAGAFGGNFIFYGFEDIDLGYRLFKQGKKIHLSEIKVYHQPSSSKRRSFIRQNELSKTAKIFFYKHLDPEIYEILRGYMSQGKDFSYFFPNYRGFSQGG